MAAEMSGKNLALQQIDYEIHSLYERYQKAGYTDDELDRAASVLLNPTRKTKLKYIAKFILVCICIVFIRGMLASLDSDMKYAQMTSRIILIKILPFWDWRYLYNAPCLVTNPFYVEPQLTQSDCEICEDITELDRLKNTSTEEISETYLENDTPVIVIDGMNDWPVWDDNFSHRNVTMSFMEEPEFLDIGVCMFQTNLRVPGQRSLLRKINENPDLEKWYAHWENCDKETEKFLRRFYKRPYFLPLGVEMTSNNWIFMSSWYRGKTLKKIEPEGSATVMWFAQIRGSNEIMLTPKTPCEETCPSLNDVLYEGEILLVPVSFWKIKYFPGEDSKNFAIAAGGFYQ